MVPLIVGHCAHHSNATLALYTPFNPQGEPLATLGEHARDRELARLVALLATPREAPSA